MKGGNEAPLPPELRRRLAAQPPEERRKAAQVWTLLEGLDADALDAPGPDAAWAELQQRIDAAAPTPTAARKAPDRGPERRRRVRVGLSMAVVAALVLGAWWWKQPVRVAAPPGAQQTVVLPDGSTVHLNSDSRVQYARRFEAWPFVPAGPRRVTLDGEAFFEVVPEARPFVVETFNARVEVLGTQFNVRARQGSLEGETRVILASGRVRVTARAQPDASVVLAQAGQSARIADAATTRAPTPSQVDDLDRVLAWRQQGFAVVDQPLGAILAEVERRYALRLEIDEDLALTDSMSVFYLRGALAPQILHDLCLAQGCRYRRTSTGFAVFPADSPLIP